MRNPATVNWGHIAHILDKKLNPDRKPFGDEPRAAVCRDCGDGFLSNGVLHVRCTACNRTLWQKQKKLQKPSKSSRVAH